MMNKKLLNLIFTLIFGSVLLSSYRAYSKETSEYSYSWLEPDKKIYVVQNRKYEKAMKLDFTLSGGLGLSDPYSSTIPVVPRLSFYFTEHWGLEAFGGFSFVSDNITFRTLQAVTPNQMPIIDNVKQFYGGQVSWIPWYAKLNMFDKILYLDWIFGIGGGVIKNERRAWDTRVNGQILAPTVTTYTSPGFVWNIGNKYFITRNLSARLDLISFLYSQKANTSGGASSFVGDYFVTLGLSYLF